LTQLNVRARNLGEEGRGDTLRRPELEREVIGLEWIGPDVRDRKHLAGRGPEGDGHRAPCLRHALPGAEVEGNAGPAPVVDEDAPGDERLRIRVGCDALLASVTLVL